MAKKKEGKVINIRFINNDGAGWAENVGVREGTTVSEFLEEQMGSDVDFSAVMIRVDNMPVTAGDVLKNDQVVIATPTNIAGG